MYKNWADGGDNLINEAKEYANSSSVSGAKIESMVADTVITSNTMAGHLRSNILEPYQA